MKGGLHSCSKDAAVVVEEEVEKEAASSYSSLASHHDMIVDFDAEKSLVALNCCIHVCGGSHYSSLHSNQTPAVGTLPDTLEHLPFEHLPPMRIGENEHKLQ